MTKQIKSLSDLFNMSINTCELMEDHIGVMEEKLDKARRTNFFVFIIGTIIGCGLTLIGIGIGLWTGVL